MIGGKPTVLLTVTSDIANGEIGFDVPAGELIVTVDEPEGDNAQPLRVSLNRMILSVSI